MVMPTLYHNILRQQLEGKLFVCLDHRVARLVPTLHLEHSISSELTRAAFLW